MHYILNASIKCIFALCINILDVSMVRIFSLYWYIECIYGTYLFFILIHYMYLWHIFALYTIILYARFIYDTLAHYTDILNVSMPHICSIFWYIEWIYYYLRPIFARYTDRNLTFFVWSFFLQNCAHCEPVFTLSVHQHIPRSNRLFLVIMHEFSPFFSYCYAGFTSNWDRVKWSLASPNAMILHRVL